MSKVSIIITAYSPKSKPYLDLLIRSVANLDYANKEVLLITPKDYAPTYENVITLSPDWDEDRGNDAAINYGISKADVNSNYLFILNDDVILTRNCLTNLVNTSMACADNCLLMPYGNDTQQRLLLHCPIPNGQYRIENISNIADKMINCDSLYPNGIAFYDTLCLYAFLLPRKIYNTIGGMDESFSTGPSDIDFTLRVVRAGFKNAIVLDSLVFHAGGTTADFTQSMKDRERNQAAFEAKWGKGIL